MLWLSFTVAAVAPADALGAPQWLGSVPVSDPGEQNSRPRVAFSGQSEVIMAWTRATCSVSGENETCSNQRMQTAIKPPGLPFGPPQTVTGDPGAASLFDSEVAADAQGGAVVVWASFENGSNKVRYAVRAPGQPFGPAQTMTNDPGVVAGNVALAVDPAGNMVAIWASGPNASSRSMRYAIGTTLTGFGPSQPMPGDATADSSSASKLAHDGLGNFIAVWTKRNAMNAARAQVAIGNLGGFAPAEQIDDVGSAFDSVEALATDDQGNAVLAMRSSVSMTPTALKYALKPPGLPFGELQTFTGTTGEPGNIDVAVAPGGRAIAIWSYNDFPTRALRFAVREPGSGFGPAQPMPPDPGQEPGGADVTFDAAGNALATWVSYESGALKVRWASAAAGQPFMAFGGTLTGPDASGIGPENAIDPQGNAVAVWQKAIPTMSTDIDAPAVAAGYDAAGPLMRDLSLPTDGNTARPLTFSLEPVDVWSPPVSTRFSFGDGQATTAAVNTSHRYTKAGRFDLSITATDAVGNASTVGGSVQIADKTAPVISRLSMTRRVFLVGPKGTARRAAKRRKPGSAFRYRLSERANVAIKIARVLRGRRVGKRCRKPTGKLLRRPRCKRYVAAGTLTRRNRRAGRNVVAFSGRIGKRALKPGTYRATLTAVDRARNRSKAKRITFRIAG